MLLRIAILLCALLWLTPVVQAQSVSSAPGTPVSREVLQDIQQMLEQLGYQPGPADGIMGARTREAIRQYQSNAGMAVDGQPSERLRDVLRAATGKPPVSASDTRRAAWQGITTSEVLVYPEPSSEVTSSARLAAGTEVDVFRRRGAWLEVRARSAGAADGWVKFSSVRPLEQAKAPAQAQPQAQKPAESGGFFSGFSNLARGVTRLLGGAGPSGEGGTVTVGVRGLAAEDLAAAQPNPAELEKMERYRSDRDQAYRFASQARLTSQTVDYLSERRAPSAGGQPPASSGGRN